MAQDIQDDIDSEHPNQLPGGAMEISLDDPVDDEDDDGEELQAEPTRREKRRHRGNRYREAQEALARQKAEHQAEIERMKSELSNFRQEVYQYADQLESTGETQDELTTLREEEDELAKQWAMVAQHADEKTAKWYRDKHQQIKDQRQRVLIRQETAARQQPAQQPGNPAVRYMADSEFPEVVSDQKALQWADAYHRQQLIEGRPNNIALAREAFEAARDKFKLGGRSYRENPPSKNERARYAGYASSGGGSRSSNNTFTMTPELRSIADAMYPDIKDAGKRYQKWAREVYLKGEKK